MLPACHTCTIYSSLFMCSLFIVLHTSQVASLLCVAWHHNFLYPLLQSGANWLMMSSVVSTQYIHVTNRQTDRPPHNSIYYTMHMRSVEEGATSLIKREPFSANACYLVIIFLITILNKTLKRTKQISVSTMTYATVYIAFLWSFSVIS